MMRETILAFAMGLTATATTALELPAIFSDHMVLQRDVPVAVWGKSNPGDSIRVQFNDAEADTTADLQGFWKLYLPAMEASAQPRTLTVAVVAGHGIDGAEPQDGGNALRYDDVLVGEVWHCSGQSNMQWSVAQSNDAETEVAAADFPLIRHFTTPRFSEPQPVFSGGGQWQVTSPQTIGDFSAVGYFFGRRIQQELGVPVGLIDTSWGGAAAEAYVSYDSLLKIPAMEDKARQQKESDLNPQPPAEGEPPIIAQHRTFHLYHGMIQPVAPYSHRGVLWYQGENNSGYFESYPAIMQALLADWRSLWASPDDSRVLPFYLVQLANFQQADAKPRAMDHWAELRLRQSQIAAEDDQVWLTTAVDIGQADDVHPRNKQEVGRRLALLSLKYTYGETDMAADSPTFADLSFDPVQPRQVILSFNDATGLQTTDGSRPRGFAVLPQGSEEWSWAAAEVVDENRIRLTAAEGLAGPFVVRYAYQINPTDGEQGINTVNAAGLPLLPFDSSR